MFDFTENKGFAEGMGPRDLMRLKTEAVEASINNRLALFMRRLVCEAGLDEDELMARMGMDDDPERFTAILMGVEEPTKSEVMKFAKVFADLIMVSGERNVEEPEDELVIYTDGGYRPDSGIGAWTYIVVKNDRELFRDHGRMKDTSSHEMETVAMLQALKRIRQEKIEKAKFVSDDKSLIDMIESGTILPPGWYRGDKCTPMQEMYGEIGTIVRKNPGFSFEWTKGHNGNAWNEACDAFCSHEMWKAKVEERSDDDSWTVYTDGAQKPGAGKGAWGYVAVRNGREAYRKVMCPVKTVSIQEMEIQALLEAVKRLEGEQARNVRFVSNNRQLIDAVANAMIDAVANAVGNTCTKTKTKMQKLTAQVVEAFLRNPTFSLEWSRDLKNDPWVETCGTMCDTSLKKRG